MSSISASLKIIRNQSGAAAVEFAIVGPVFILIMFGMIAYGISFGAAHSVEQLAADAARASIPGLNGEERQKLASAYIDDNADEYMLLDKKHLGVEVRSSPRSTNQFNVSVTYNAENLPIWNLYLPLPTPEKIIRRSSTIRIGGI